MACINADGTLTPMAAQVLTALQSPTTITDINQKTNIPMYRIRASLRELGDLELLIETKGLFRITPKGSAILEKKAR